MPIVLEPLGHIVVTEEELKEGLAKGYITTTIIANTKEVFSRTEFSCGRHITTKIGEAGKKPVGAITSIKEEKQFLAHGNPIPVELFHQIIAFFKKVMTDKINTKGKTMSTGHGDYEAMAHIVWNDATQQYRVAIPTQTVSKAAVNYSNDHLEDGDVIILDIHSHNTMGAFFSGTDNGDDRHMVSISGVAGNLQKSIPDFVWRFNQGATKHEIKDMSEIFCDTQPEVEVPGDWMSKVTVQSYSAPAYSYPGYGGRGGYRSGGANYNYGMSTQGRNQAGNVHGQLDGTPTKEQLERYDRIYGKDNNPLRAQMARQASRQQGGAGLGKTPASKGPVTSLEKSTSVSKTTSETAQSGIAGEVKRSREVAGTVVGNALKEGSKNNDPKEGERSPKSLGSERSQEEVLNGYPADTVGSFDNPEDFDDQAYLELLDQLNNSPIPGDAVMAGIEEEFASMGGYGGLDDLGEPTDAELQQLHHLIEEDEQLPLSHQSGLDWMANGSELTYEMIVEEGLGADDMAAIAKTCTAEDLKEFALNLLGTNIGELTFLQSMGLYHVRDEDEVPLICETIVSNHVSDREVINDASAAMYGAFDSSGISTVDTSAGDDEEDLPAVVTPSNN